MDYGRDIRDSMSKADLSFGLSLMSHLGDGNLAVSPASIRTALSMLYEGARGDAAKEIAKAAGLPEDAEARHEAFGRLSRALNATDGENTVRYANGIWVANQFPVNAAYRDTLTASYGAEAKSADFEGDPERERASMNRWVSEKTEDKIPELFKANSINQLTALALANALYFKAVWENKFDAQYTQKQDYTLPNGQTVQVDMMRKGRIDSPEELPEFQYGELDGAQVVMMSYKGHALSKIVMLPPKGSDVKSLERRLIESPMSFMELFRLVIGSREFERLEIPKHELEGSYDLLAPLKAMGIEKVFTESTDGLSGIGAGPLRISAAQHETFFKTDEEGSEGAAATAMVATLGGGGSPKPVEFVADRPFLEVITDTMTGAFLFVNRVEDPRA